MNDKLRDKLEDKRDRVARVRFDAHVLSRLLLTPKTEILAILPNYDLYGHTSLTMDIRHEDLPKVEIGQKMPEMALGHSVCRAGHIQRIFVCMTDHPSGYREINIYDRRQMHEECPMPNFNLRPGPVEP